MFVETAMDGINGKTMITSHDKLRKMILDATGFESKDNDACTIDVCDGASYVPGKGFQGVKVTMALPYAHRIMGIYSKYPQPVVSTASVFNPGEGLTDEQYDQITKNVEDQKANIMRMTQKMLIEKDSDVAQFFAHYGKFRNIKDMYKKTQFPRNGGALCVWSAPDVSHEQAADIEEKLVHIAKLNGGADANSECDSVDYTMEDGSADEPQHTLHKGRHPEDEALHNSIVSSLNASIQALGRQAEDFNRSYAFALCEEAGIPTGSISDENWRKLYTTVTCNHASLSVENDHVCAHLNENKENQGHVIMFHSPESGSTVYEIQPNADAESHARFATMLGRYEDTNPALEENRKVLPHGIQIPPKIDGISSNRYATNEVSSTYKEDVVHKDAWIKSDSAHHLSSNFYLSGAPHPVAKDGITDSCTLKMFLDNLVLNEEHAHDAPVYIPDKNAVVCDIIRKAHPSNWVDILTSDSCVKDEAGDIVGWNIPLDKLDIA